jgi:hypothetical protein
MSWIDPSGGEHPSESDELTPERLTHLITCDRCQKLPGSDWPDVEEGTDYTPEQAARRFLSLSWEEQVARMERFLEDSGTALACHMLNHEGAHIFATQHTCHDRYEEGRLAGLLATDRPRVVEVCYDRDGHRYSDRDQIRYGQAITGWPIRLATITEAPRDNMARAWIDETLSTFIAPGGMIVHAYEEQHGD